MRNHLKNIFAMCFQLSVSVVVMFHYINVDIHSEIPCCIVVNICNSLTASEKGQV